MRNAVIVFYFSFSSLFSQSLLEFSETQIELGEIKNEAGSFTDIPVYNNSEKRIYILRTEAPQDVLVQYTSKTIEPGTSEYIRLKFTPQELGRFSRKLRVFTSDRPEATAISFSGNALYIEQSKSPACPDFSSVKPRPSIKQQTSPVLVTRTTNTNNGPTKTVRETAARPFSSTIEVHDKTTQKPIPGARVDIYYSSSDRVREYTNRNGQIVKDDMPSGAYYLMCDASGYLPESKEVIVSETNKKVVVLLSPKEAAAPPPTQVKVAETTKKEPSPIVDTLPPKPSEGSVEEDPNELSRTRYRPNNIVFLIDLSSSMNQRNRLDLVKQSLLTLLEPLRDIDRISLVAYSGTARIVLPSTLGSEKTTIANAIQNLEAEGLTAGEKGLDLAYQIAQDNFIKQANNEIFMVTDGAFNVGGDQKTILKGVKKKAKEHIYLSVLGIKPASITEEELKTMSLEGRGSYVTISKDEDRALLLEAIKAHALNKKL